MALVSLPTRDIRLWSLDPANTAKTLLEHGRVDEAGALAMRAYAFNPRGAETNFLLGNYWLAKGDRNQAKKYYWQTLTLDPNHARAWNNSGVMAIEEKRWPTAVQLLTRAAALNPADAKTRYLLARALQGNGDLRAALEMIGTARALDPGRPEYEALARELKQQVESSVPSSAP
jgi:Flp pilus assembly protein TadD